MFTKSTVANYYPELESYLYRKNLEPTILNNFLSDFVLIVKDYLSKVDNIDKLIEEDVRSKF